VVVPAVTLQMRPAHHVGLVTGTEPTGEEDGVSG
jgi:hypothetical protein